MLFPLLIAGCVTKNDGNSSQSSEETVRRLEEKVPQIMDYDDIPGAGGALIRDGEVFWSQEFGYADREEGIPVTSDTLFRAESITKSLTGCAVMKLEEEGAIGLDDPVEKYLTPWQFPDSEFSSSEVTVRQLLSHSSGLTGGFDRKLPGKKRPPLSEVLEGEHFLHQARLVREPGSKF